MRARDMFLKCNAVMHVARALLRERTSVKRCRIPTPAADHSMRQTCAQRSVHPRSPDRTGERPDHHREPPADQGEQWPRTCPDDRPTQLEHHAAEPVPRPRAEHHGRQDDQHSIESVGTQSPIRRPATYQGQGSESDRMTQDNMNDAGVLVASV